MRNFNFLIPAQLDSRIKAESERSGASLSEIVRRAVDEYLERRERAIREPRRELVQDVR